MFGIGKRSTWPIEVPILRIVKIAWILVFMVFSYIIIAFLRCLSLPWNSMYCISLVYPIQYSATIILNTKEELQIFFFYNWTKSRCLCNFFQWKVTNGWTSKNNEVAGKHLLQLHNSLPNLPLKRHTNVMQKINITCKFCASS